MISDARVRINEHRLVRESDEKEKHATKSIVYGLLAFALALLIAGLIIKVASAFAL